MSLLTSPRAPGAGDALTSRQRTTILVTCCLSLFIVGIDIFAVNVALPSIRTELGASPSQLQWVIDAYTLVIASLLMLGGSLGDRLGRKRVFQTGLLIFGVASVLCSLAPTPEALIAGRMLQAVGGAMLNPVALSIITNVFTDPKERARAIGLWGIAMGVSMALGPVIGGLSVTTIGWEAIFWLNVPVCLLAIVLTARFVPESRADRARRFDPGGQLLIFVFLATLTLALIEGREWGWDSGRTIGCFAISAVALVLLVIWEARHPEPMIDLRFFRSVPFSGAIASAVIVFGGTAGFLFLNTLYLQQARGMTALEAGLMTLPLAAVSGVAAPMAGRLIASHGTRLPMTIGGISMAVSGVLLMGVDNATSLWSLGLIYGVLGIGWGLLNVPITNAAVSGMPRAQAGLASAMTSSGRQVGTALGVAVFGTIAFSRVDGPLGEGLAEASRPAWVILAICGVVITVLTVVVTTGWAQRTAMQTRRRITGTDDDAHW